MTHFVLGGLFAGWYGRGLVASLLVRLLVGRAVWVQPPAGNVMLLFVIGNSTLSASLHPGV